MNPTRTACRQHGFSLLEAVISLALFLVVLTITLSIYKPSRLLYTRGERKTDVQQNARLGMAEMARQIRMAGFFPENFTDAPPTPSIVDPILVASENFLTIHGAADGSAASSAFSFCLDGNLLRRINGSRASGGSYTCSSGEVLAENVTALRFTYYDENGAPVPDPPSTPYDLDDQPPGAVPDMTTVVQRESIRRVVVSLSVEWQEPNGEQQNYHLNSDVRLRNAG
ncbi:MAG: prepilin-type N-terminal cleavage/methylation domain-containing protein [bacterium]|nr:prepilin-type N-terminal cleavage/methylation domain-containing protein [bacterium]